MPKETPKAAAAFLVYQELGPGRTMAKAAAELGRKPGYRRQLEQWSRRFHWQARVAEYDHAELRRALGTRLVLRERALQRLVLAADEASETIIGIAKGQLALGQTTPVFDRHGEQVGVRAMIKPSTRLQAAIRIHESIGIVPPKRLEFIDITGEALDEAAELVRHLPNDQLTAIKLLLEKAADDPGTDRQVH
jgi:hypothetical protein